MKERIPVFFASDDGYAPYLAVSLASLMDNADTNYEYHLIILNDGLSEQHKTRLRKLKKPGFAMEFVSMKKELEKMREKESNRLRCDYFTMAIYFRLFIPDMFPQYDRGIYIDCDTVIPGDISKLYHQDLQGKLIGGCVDTSVQDVPELTRYIDESVGVDHTCYINSGVLLMDLKALREVKFSRYFLSLMNTFHFDSIAPDQDYINAMLCGQICFLDNTWDVFPERGKPEMKNPQLIHYNLFAKPWCYEGLPYESYFWKYAAMTDYYAQLRDHLINYSQKQKAQDAENEKAMGIRGVELAEHGMRFKDALGSKEGDPTGWLHQIGRQ